MTKRILFLVPYPLQESPSQRFRFEQYFQILEKNGLQFHVQSFLTPNNWKVFFVRGKVIPKAVALLKGLLRRSIILFNVRSYDIIFIHREAAPLGPPLFEWAIVRLLGRRIVFDFDDAIWLTDRQKESPLLRALKWRTKVQAICRWSYKVSCGNEFLCTYASRYNTRVAYNPTTIDTATRHNPELFASKLNSEDRVFIGWTGSHSTLKYLKEVEFVLQEIENKYHSVWFVVIADNKPDINLKRLLYVPWKLESEIEDLMIIDIGIMPLPDEEWTKGKCGFKALQYMALKIPAVTSSVGVNLTIINNSVDGYLCSNADEWYHALASLIEDPILRAQMGKNGRNKVIKHYSVSSNSSNFLAIVE